MAQFIRHPSTFFTSTRAAGQSNTYKDCAAAKTEKREFEDSSA